MAIYMKYGEINGAVTTEGFLNWIELLSVHWGTNRHVATAAHIEKNREYSEPSLSEITISKLTDVSSPKLIIESVAGELDNEVTLAFTTTSAGKMLTFLKFELQDTGLSSYGLTSNGDMPIETLTLNFATIKHTFIGLNPALKGTPEAVGYSLPKMKTM